MSARLLIVFLFIPLRLFGQLYQTTQGSAKFLSDAPLELIKAQSSKLAGLLKITDRSFAFSIPMSSFEGFNSGLQKTHFNENYVESAKYPMATFEGKIIEDVDLTAPGEYDIRGKGKFVIHGVEQIRIIKCHLVVQKDKIVVSSKFSILLADHNIKIPSVVSKKITEEILVDMNASLVAKK
jgi:polyisoprenoid-binding protein YceI